MKKIQKKKNNYKGVGVIVGVVVIVGLVSTIGVFSIVGANSGSVQERVAQIAGQMYGQFLIDQDFGEAIFGLSFTEPDSVSHIRSNTEVDANFNLTATTTVQEITLGSRYSGDLTFTAGATTTPGGLFAIQNTGDTKICDRVLIDISTEAQGSLDFSIATSSTGNTITNDSIGLMATVTVGTTTPALLEILKSNGTAITLDGESFSWVRTDFIIGQFDIKANRNNATTSDYTSAVGKFYINCHTR